MKPVPKVKYKDALVTYIDVIGFRDLVRNRKPSSILELLTAASTHLAKKYPFKNQRGKPLGRLKSLVFSDMIVRCRVPKGKADVEDFVARETFSLANQQARLVSQGVFIRGAVSWGQVCLQGALAFGPGLVRSYELEQALAIFPRIVVASDLVASKPDDYISRRDDGVAFVDYLFGAFINRHAVSGDSQAALRLLRRHKLSVEKALSSRTAKNDEHVRQKYLWVGSYHNWTLERLYERLRHSSPAEANKVTAYRLDEKLLRC